MTCLYSACDKRMIYDNPRWYDTIVQDQKHKQKLTKRREALCGDTEFITSFVELFYYVTSRTQYIVIY